MTNNPLRNLWLRLLSIQSHFIGLLALSRIRGVAKKIGGKTANNQRVLVVGGGDIRESRLSQLGTFDSVYFINSSISFSKYLSTDNRSWFFSPAFHGKHDPRYLKDVQAFCVANPPRWKEARLKNLVRKNDSIPVSNFSIIRESSDLPLFGNIYRGLRRFVWMTTGMTALLWLLEQDDIGGVFVIGFDLYEKQNNGFLLGHSITVERKLLDLLVDLGKVNRL